ncbi:hypothetical protein SEA_PUPPER_41 [Gordonia phage Pupper]|uniref:Uncharacterized protein n=1 Tax=Gordonia phage Pupper TaxID=2571249 RepID=A0A4Y6EIG6_9CAUD|nr:hypothetical protein KHQ83_gp041 [Gordonia phage Pupper]QDF18528.1 hypothetical protein SEA_PUPPER_41 [Gordonia phage Pupper]QDF18761.1 hypothetical protein SEA_SCENTAE_41 [Gordonia phage SCentae]
MGDLTPDPDPVDRRQLWGAVLWLGVAIAIGLFILWLVV